MLVLTDLYVYPIKSLGGIRLTEAHAEARGLRYDRRWLLVDADNRFLTQRTFAEMALLTVALSPTHLIVRHRYRPELGELAISLAEPASTPIVVQIWNDAVPAQPVSADADAWFTNALGKSVRLVYMPDTTRRPVDPSRTPADTMVSFADAYPFLIIGQGTLDHLNQQLAQPVPMDRFRPNFVFQGGAPHQEDTWADFRIGTVPFRGIKPCGRCVVTTINQQTAQTGKEPLRTLSTYRRDGAKVLFGMNVIVTQPGTVRVGDEVRPGNEQPV